MKSAVFFMLFVLVMCPLAVQNLVANPGLENWDSPTKPTGWTTSTKCTLESVNFHSGSHSCMHAGSASTRGDMGQTIAIVAGKNYTLSLFYMTGVPTTGAGARVWCYWKDANGASLTDPLTDDLLRSAYLSSPAWAQYSVNITAPQGAVALYLEVRTYINSIMYWDDFTLEESIPTGYPDDIVPGIDIYPIPAADRLMIRSNRALKSIEIIDLKGSVLKSGKIPGLDETELQVNDLSEGFYILKLGYEGKIITRKFLKK